MLCHCFSVIGWLRSINIQLCLCSLYGCGWKVVLFYLCIYSSENLWRTQYQASDMTRKCHITDIRHPRHRKEESRDSSNNTATITQSQATSYLFLSEISAKLERKLTVVPDKIGGNVILCLQLPSRTLTCTLHLS